MRRKILWRLCFGLAVSVATILVLAGPGHTAGP